MTSSTLATERLLDRATQVHVGAERAAVALFARSGDGNESSGGRLNAEVLTAGHDNEAVLAGDLLDL
jgi:hypothetical protein